MRSLTRVGLFVITIVAGGVSPSVRAAEIVLCHNVCVCYSWVSGATAYYEVRCPDGSASGWTTSPTLPPDGSNGTWQGSGTPQSPPSTLPGQPLFGEAAMAVSSGKVRRR